MTDSIDPLDKQLNPRLEPHRDLTEDIFKRIDHERVSRPDDDDAIDETLEILLRAWPVGPRKRFAEETLRLACTSEPARVIHWAGFAQTAALLAACLAIAFILPSGTGPLPASTAQMTANEKNPIDEDVAMLLALADGLPQTSRWLLEEAPLLTLVSERP